MNKKVVLKIAYDGTDFHGWQVQKQDRSVQAVLADAWQTWTGAYCLPYGSGRTDAGVHACGQIATFPIYKEYIPAEKYALALNSFLPKDVCILKSWFATGDFDPRRSALWRMYGYDIKCSPILPPQEARYMLAVPQALSLCRLNALAGLFVGAHDFTAFCSAHDCNKNKVRHVYTSTFYALPDGRIRYEISANGFLMNMVRAIVGNILYFYNKTDGHQRLVCALRTQCKQGLGPVASPCGLSLMHVAYPEGLFIY